jgi:hypothetical protein
MEVVSTTAQNACQRKNAAMKAAMPDNTKAAMLANMKLTTKYEALAEVFTDRLTEMLGVDVDVDVVLANKAPCTPTAAMTAAMTSTTADTE